MIDPNYLLLIDLSITEIEGPAEFYNWEAEEEAINHMYDYKNPREEDTMNEIEKMQESVCEAFDLRSEIEDKLGAATDPVEIKKLQQILAQIDNSVEAMDLEIKYQMAQQEMENHFDIMGSAEKYVKEHEKYTGGPPDKEYYYEIMGEIARENIDDLVDETAVLPTKPINSWDD